MIYSYIGASVTLKRSASTISGFWKTWPRLDATDNR